MTLGFAWNALRLHRQLRRLYGLTTFALLLGQLRSTVVFWYGYL